jgi:hypothetical protein
MNSTPYVATLLQLLRMYYTNPLQTMMMMMTISMNLYETLNPMSPYNNQPQSTTALCKATPLQALGLQEVEAPRISRQSAHEGGKVISPTHPAPKI